MSARKKKVGKSSSGAHVSPRYLLSLESHEQLARWREAAARDGRTLAGWLRHVADKASK